MHRDLHIGNIMIRKVNSEYFPVLIDLAMSCAYIKDQDFIDGGATYYENKCEYSLYKDLSIFLYNLYLYGKVRQKISNQLYEIIRIIIEDYGQANKDYYFYENNAEFELFLPEKLKELLKPIKADCSVSNSCNVM
jgi:hypothetical protein